MNPPVTVDALLREGVAALSKSGARDTPALDAGLLLGQVLGVTRARLGSHPELPVAAATAAAFRQLIARRADGEPLAYITGRREFWSLELSVTPDVLVPRPETELLVERALALGARGSAQVADLGTGSGAIALALAHERPQWQLVATDIAPASLAVARSNAAALGTTNVEFRLGSWYEALPVRSFDVVVSNPPYVAAADPALEALRHEPRGALTPGVDAFAALRDLARGAPPHLAQGGWLVLEHGASQGEQLRQELVLAGFRHVRSHRDLAGHERTTEGQR